MYFGYGIRQSTGSSDESEKRQLNSQSQNETLNNDRIQVVGSYVNTGFIAQQIGSNDGNNITDQNIISNQSIVQ